MQRLFLLITTALPQSKQKQRILWQVLPYLPLGKGEAAKKDSPRTRDTIETRDRRGRVQGSCLGERESHALATHKGLTALQDLHLNNPFCPEK